MKKKTLILPILALAAGGLIACTNTQTNAGGNGSNNNSNGNSAVTDNDTIKDVVTGTAGVHELYAFEAATTLGQLSYLDLALPQLASPPVTADVNDSSAPASSSQPTSSQTQDDGRRDLIDDYLPSVEAALMGSSSLMSMETKASDKAEYSTLIVVTYTDESLSQGSFSMYFNETIIQDYDDDDDDHDDDQEQESYIEGIIVKGEETYTIRGDKEIEADEIEVKFVTRIDEKTYVQVEQEKENNEQEFSYEVYRAGNKVYEYSIEVEDNEVELEVKDKEALKDLQIEFEIERRGEKTYLKAEIQENGRTTTYFYEKVVDAEGNSSWQPVTL